MDENMMEPINTTEPAEEVQAEPETVTAPSESNENGERVQEPKPNPAPSAEAEAEKKETDPGELGALAREFLQLLRREQKAERSIGGESAAGSAGADLTQRERANLADWNRRWPELSMTPGEWKEKRK